VNHRVAVVIPCFNDGSTLPEAIDSVAAQEACELAVVDDGSSDPATLSVLDELRRAGTKVITQANAGPALARMTGVTATAARYVHPLDADDRLAPGALSALADALDAHPSAAAAWGSYRTFGTTSCHFPTAPHLDPWRITYLDEIPGTTMVRREAIEAVGGWEPGVGYEDWDFWMKLAERGLSGVGIQQVTLHYRERDGGGRYSEDLTGHARHYGGLRERRHALFAARRRNRRLSDAPRALKLALPAIDVLPGLSEARKRQLWGMARYLIQPEMASDCYRGPLARVRERLARR
jgi:glycosyltransferase involved in cell wall biosynthesis